MNEITANNIVEKITEQVKRHPKEPFYYFYVGNSLCVYEILVNDFPIQKSFKYEQQATPIYINNAILKSGKQKVTYRIYPAPAEYNGGKDTFSPNTKFDVEVYVNDNARGLQVGEEISITEHKAPTKVRMAGSNNDIALKEFEGKGQKYFEHSFYFDAEVPYINEGWSKGEDLTKLNQKDLEKEVLSFYKNYKSMYDDKLADKLAQNVFGMLKRNSISEYEDKKEIEPIWTEYLEMLNIKKEFMPLDSYKIAFYGDGKIICLIQSNEQDNRLKGKSALWFKCDTPKGKMRRFLGLYLYLPQGKSLNELQVIK